MNVKHQSKILCPGGGFILHILVKSAQDEIVITRYEDYGMEGDGGGYDDDRISQEETPLSILSRSLGYVIISRPNKSLDVHGKQEINKDHLASFSLKSVKVMHHLDYGIISRPNKSLEVHSKQEINEDHLASIVDNTSVPFLFVFSQFYSTL